MPRLVFRPLPILSLCTLAAFAILLQLGFWQLDRLAWKTALIERMEARAAAEPVPLETALDRFGPGLEREFRRVSVTGRFDHDGERHLFGTQGAGQAGYFILTPLIRADGPPVLVNRGFVPADRKAPDTRAAGQIAGPVTVTGPIRLAEPARALTPDADRAANIWYRRDLAGMAEASGLDVVAPVFVQAEAGPAGGPEPLEAVVALTNNHLTYAWTWFIFAGCLIAIYAAFHIAQGRLALDRTGIGRP